MEWKIYRSAWGVCAVSKNFVMWTFKVKVKDRWYVNYSDIDYRYVTFTNKKETN